MLSFRVSFFIALFCPAVSYTVVLCCLLRKSIFNFVTVDSGVSFHPFEFYCPFRFVQVYCSLPDSFYEVDFDSCLYWGKAAVFFFFFCDQKRCILKHVERNKSYFAHVRQCT